ncbi:hypothetical protein [uncultured Chryseobacterium sp.]|uniref:hypothetical protein n=1 Tax=uncultured Chryseobacterium sp. TaxID=259322 RepID=UPI0025E48172|nr:hypothetical protein [uncultured Chryseobacterium sp.]
MSLIRQDYHISAYPGNRWVIEISGHHFIISNESKALMDILSESETYYFAVSKFNACFNDNLDEEAFGSLVRDVFSKIPIFENNAEEIAGHKNFIKFQMPLIKATTAGKLIIPFRFLFNKKIFWTFFSILSILAAYTVFRTSPLESAENFPVLWVMILYLPTIFIHELGHIAACNTYTGKNGEIGFGIYFIFPVFYSDISSVWHADKEERIIANLGGVYLQMFAMLIFLLLYYILQEFVFFYMAYIMAVYSFIQLIPFIRSDGYWLLSDLSSTPNLQEKSAESVFMLIKTPLDSLKPFSYKKLFILVYGLFNTAVFGYFITIQLLFNWREILDFPMFLFDALKKTVLMELSSIHLPQNMVTTIIFYMISYSYLKKIKFRKKHQVSGS